MSNKMQEMQKAALGEGCLGKAYPDEPVFILRAQDILAPPTIEHWARLLEVSGKVGVTQKINEARAIAHEMRAWQERHSRKLPD